LEQLFVEIDVDGSGEIDEDELRELMCHLGLEMSEEDIAMIFSSICKFNPDTAMAESFGLEAFIGWWHSQEPMAAVVKEAIGAREGQRRKKGLRKLLAAFVLRMAELSDFGRPPAIAAKWAHLQQEQNFLQGDREFQAGLSASPFFDRNSPLRARTMASFIESVVRPMFTAAAQIFPGAKLLVHNCDENRLRFERLSKLPSDQVEAMPPAITPEHVKRALELLQEVWQQSDGLHLDSKKEKRRLQRAADKGDPSKCGGLVRLRSVMDLMSLAEDSEPISKEAMQCLSQADGMCTM